ncbi:uncharacterized protein LOC125433326 [Sphaerodactylus townsendi]|nr:uncharacterized protein LOC125433326 [Sphaerodactylus townsendi]
MSVPLAGMFQQLHRAPRSLLSLVKPPRTNEGPPYHRGLCLAHLCLAVHAPAGRGPLLRSAHSKAPWNHQSASPLPPPFHTKLTTLSTPGNSRGQSPGQEGGACQPKPRGAAGTIIHGTGKEKPYDCYSLETWPRVLKQSQLNSPKTLQAISGLERRYLNNNHVMCCPTYQLIAALPALKSVPLPLESAAVGWYINPSEVLVALKSARATGWQPYKYKKRMPWMFLWHNRSTEMTEDHEASEGKDHKKKISGTELKNFLMSVVPQIEPAVINNPNSKPEKLSAKEVKQWSQSLAMLLSTQGGQDAFREFLKSEFSDENIDFWLACEDYKKTQSDHLHDKAEKIYKEFVQSDAIKQINIDFYTRKTTVQKAQNPTTSSFDEAQKSVYVLMEKDSYPRFLKSSFYLNQLNQVQPNSLK